MPAFPSTPTRLLRILASQPVSEEDESAWEKFVELYEPVLRAYAAAEEVPPDDIDDVVQDIFVRLVRVMRRDGYDRKQGRFRTYLRTIVRRVLIDRFRRQAADRAQLHEPLNEDETQVADTPTQMGAASLPDAVEAFEGKWRQAQFKALLDHVFNRTALSDQSRAIYRAYALEDGDVHEVARRFGVTPEVVRQVKSRVNRMIAALARRLED